MPLSYANGGRLSEVHFKPVMRFRKAMFTCCPLWVFEVPVWLFVCFCLPLFCLRLFCLCLSYYFLCLTFRFTIQVFLFCLHCPPFFPSPLPLLTLISIASFSSSSPCLLPLPFLLLPSLIIYIFSSSFRNTGASRLVLPAWCFSLGHL